MERFRIRVRNEPKRGHIWELELFPLHTRRAALAAEGRMMGSASNPEVVLWLRKLSERALSRAEEPEPISSTAFGPADAPRWLRLEDGMRLALAFVNARWLKTAADRRRFQAELDGLPSEVILYWFTLCFYGHRQAAGRMALRALLTYEDPDEQAGPTRAKQLLLGSDALPGGPPLFVRDNLSELAEYNARTLPPDLAKGDQTP